MRVVIFVAGLLTSSLVYAGAWSDWVKVEEAYTHTNGHLYIKFSTMIDPDGCGDISYMRVDKNHSESIKNRIYSTLLNGLSTGQEVNYYVSGCLTYPLVTAIRIRPLK